MEYAKEIIFNVGYKRVNGVISEIKLKFIKIYKILQIVANIVKKWTSNIVKVIKNNKIISITIAVLLILIAADFILLDNFIKLFSTLY